MNLLAQDRDKFNTLFPNAMDFLNAANLRYEFYTLTRLKMHNLLSSWEETRLEELQDVPAVKEKWFVDYLTTM